MARLMTQIWARLASRDRYSTVPSIHELCGLVDRHVVIQNGFPVLPCHSQPGVEIVHVSALRLSSLPSAGSSDHLMSKLTNVSVKLRL